MNTGSVVALGSGHHVQYLEVATSGKFAKQRYYRIPRRHFVLASLALPVTRWLAGSFPGARPISPGVAWMLGLPGALPGCGAGLVPRPPRWGWVLGAPARGSFVWWPSGTTGPDAGTRIADAGFRMPVSGCRFPDEGTRMPDFGGGPSAMVNMLRCSSTAVPFSVEDKYSCYM